MKRSERAHVERVVEIIANLMQCSDSCGMLSKVDGVPLVEVIGRVAMSEYPTQQNVFMPGGGGGGGGGVGGGGGGGGGGGQGVGRQCVRALLNIVHHTDDSSWEDDAGGGGWVPAHGRGGGVRAALHLASQTTDVVTQTWASNLILALVSRGGSKCPQIAEEIAGETGVHALLHLVYSSAHEVSRNAMAAAAQLTRWGPKLQFPNHQAELSGSPPNA